MSLSIKDENYLRELKIKLVKNCPKCHGSGVPCICWDKYSLEVKQANYKVPYKFRHFTLDTLESEDVQVPKEKVKKYIKSLKDNYIAGKGLLLWGRGKGTGKTTLGCIVLNEAIKLGYSVHFTTLDDCIALITSGWYDEDKKQEFVDNILNSDFLLIDDVGGRESKVKGSSLLLESGLTTLFKQRSDDMLPTIMTSNLALPQLEPEFGERLYSSACECLKPINCSGIDWRIKIGEEMEDDE